MRALLITGFFVFTFASCEEQFGTDEKLAPQKIIDISRQLFLGNVEENTTVIEDGEAVWKVSISNNQGSLVSFYWQKSYSIIFKIRGERGPYEYDLQPPLNVLPLSTARFLAFESYSTKALSSWSLERSKSDNRGWIYYFYIQGAESPFVINAASGDTVQD